MTTRELPNFNPTTIVVICGYVCSGKTTLSQQLIEKYQYKLIKISDVVKSLAQDNSDKSRIGIASQEISFEAIENRLLFEVNKAITLGNPVIIDGIRRPQYLKAVLMQYGLGDITMIWLEVSPEEGRRRFASRASKYDDNVSYDDCISIDNKLGLDEVRAFITNARVVDTQTPGQSIQNLK